MVNHKHHWSAAVITATCEVWKLGSGSGLKATGVANLRAAPGGEVAGDIRQMIYIVPASPTPQRINTYNCIYILYIYVYNAHYIWTYTVWFKRVITSINDVLFDCDCLLHFPRVIHHSKSTMFKR